MSYWRFLALNPDIDRDHVWFDVSQNGTVSFLCQPHKKVGKPSSAGWIDRSVQVTQVFAMKVKDTISALLDALACLFFAIALVLSPPSAAHASAGMHGDHHASVVGSDAMDSSHAHGAKSSHDKCGSVASSEDQDQSSGQCCSGICLSVVLDEGGTTFATYTTRGKYPMLHAQTASIDPAGFLRPPQYLI